MCVSMRGSEPQFVAELLVRVLRNERLDARHVTVEELADPPADAKLEAVGTVFVVGTMADKVVAEDGPVLNECLAHLPQASLVFMLPIRPGGRAPVNQIAADRVHHTAYSFEEAVALVGARAALTQLPSGHARASARCALTRNRSFDAVEACRRPSAI